MRYADEYTFNLIRRNLLQLARIILSISKFTNSEEDKINSLSYKKGSLISLEGLDLDRKERSDLLMYAFETRGDFLL